ncbi:MAG: nuclear transport factor 2 family protein [Acidipropionibacterium sp.]|nr:nuclear transport factor 2 family protein [Acidipropionibacterium sp.]
MNIDRLVATYLNALGSADTAGIIALFAPGGRVHSPLYGLMKAADFYPMLFDETDESVLHLRKVLKGDQVIAFWFDFDWTLADGTPAPFTCVDVAELDVSARITDLHIVYDTSTLREAWTRQHLAVTD